MGTVRMDASRSGSRDDTSPDSPELDDRVAERSYQGSRRMWILHGQATETGDLIFRVRPGTTKTVGRAPRADLIVEASLVSRLHCRLEAGTQRIDVVDLSSTNGTYVNDRRIERATLSDGDRLRVGRVELTVELETLVSR